LGHLVAEVYYQKPSIIPTVSRIVSSIFHFEPLISKEDHRCTYWLVI
jgi:hypothetical protein